MAPSWGFLKPSWFQVGSKIAILRPKRGATPKQDLRAEPGRVPQHAFTYRTVRDYSLFSKTNTLDTETSRRTQKHQNTMYFHRLFNVFWVSGGQVLPKLEPRWGQVGLRWGSIGPNWGQVGPSWPQVGPSWSRLGPSWLQVGPRWPKLASSWAKLGPSWAKLGPSWAKLAPSWAQVGPNWGQVGSSWDQVGAKWGQVGPS